MNRRLALGNATAIKTHPEQLPARGGQGVPERERALYDTLPRMDANLWVDIVSNGFMLGVAIYAIRDTRKQAVKAIFLERNQVYARIRNDMAWLYIDPTDRAQTSEIAKGLEEFCNIAQEAEPGKWTIEDLKRVVENESLHFAETLVKSGYATWKVEMSLAVVEQRLLSWQTDKNRTRIGGLLNKKEKDFLF